MHRALSVNARRSILNGFLHDGIVFGEEGHLAEAGIVRFDGREHWSHDATLMSQGELRHISSLDGAYTVNPNCTGTSELRGSRTFTFDFVVFNGGKELMQIATRPDRIVTWEIRKRKRSVVPGNDRSQEGGPILHITNPNGAHSVNADCTASASLAKTPIGVANWALAIVAGGEEILQIATTPSRGAVTWVLTRQFSR